MNRIKFGMKKTNNLKTKGNVYPNMSNITQKWVELLMPLTSNYKNKMSETELARLSKIPQQTASRYLNELVKNNLLDYTRQGRNKLFYFDYSKQTTKIIFEILENSKALVFQKNLNEAALIVNEMLKYAESIIIFGSYASYKFNKSSDLDVVFLGKSNEGELKKIKQRQIMQINEHYVSYEEFAKILRSRNSLALEIANNHILFGNISKIVNIFIDAL